MPDDPMTGWRRPAAHPDPAASTVVVCAEPSCQASTEVANSYAVHLVDRWRCKQHYQGPLAPQRGPS